MKTIIEAALERPAHPLRVLQFGEGNFLRAFVDHMLDIANEQGVFDGSVAIVKPRPHGSLEVFRQQGCRYTVVLRGQQEGCTVDGSRIVSSVGAVYDCAEDYDRWMALAACDTLRFVVSNTTEAGITLDTGDRFDGLPDTYPGKLTKFLYARYRAFGGDRSRGLILLPTELIENNGGKLRDCVLALCTCWQLPEDFRRWVEEACVFCSTLVDRIVTGYPGAAAAAAIERRLGYTDRLLDVGEPFALWVIESAADIRGELPLDKAGLPVVFTADLRPYRERKVRVLNGAHTATVLAGYLCGLDIVRDCMHDPLLGQLVRRVVQEEIVPYVPLPPEETLRFAASVFERFENPFIDHKLLSISLNSVSKWKTRVLPSLRDYIADRHALPPLLTFSFAALLAFYRSGQRQADGLLARRKKGDEYVIHDSAAVLDFFAAHAAADDRAYVAAIAAHTEFWGEDLTAYAGFVDAVTRQLAALEQDPCGAVAHLLEENR